VSTLRFVVAVIFVDEWACSTIGSIAKCVNRRLEGKGPFGRSNHWWEDPIKMGREEAACEGMDGIHVAQDTILWEDFVKTVSVCGFLKRQRILWPIERLVACQVKLCFLELICWWCIWGTFSQQRWLYCAKRIDHYEFPVRKDTKGSRRGRF
jgi:hypothetical protein